MIAWGRVQRSAWDLPFTPLPLVQVAQKKCDRDEDSHSEDLSDELGDDESGDKNQRKRKKAKFPTRKRKSNSSGAETLQFLHSYSEKREKVEAEKLALMNNMKDEKRVLFSIPGIA